MYEDTARPGRPYAYELMSGLDNGYGMGYKACEKDSEPRGSE